MSRRNPPQKANALIYCSFSGFFLFMVTRSLVNGSFLWSEGRRPRKHHSIVSPETHPFFYWGWLGFCTLLILWFGYLGWKEIQALRKQRGSDRRRC